MFQKLINTLFVTMLLTVFGFICFRFGQESGYKIGRVKAINQIQQTLWINGYKINIQDKQPKRALALPANKAPDVKNKEVK